MVFLAACRFFCRISNWAYRSHILAKVNWNKTEFTIVKFGEKKNTPLKNWGSTWTFSCQEQFHKRVWHYSGHLIELLEWRNNSTLPFCGGWGPDRPGTPAVFSPGPDTCHLNVPLVIFRKNFPSFGEMQTGATDLAFLHDQYLNYCSFVNEDYMLTNEGKTTASWNKMLFTFVLEMTTETWVWSVTLTSSSSYRA